MGAAICTFVGVHEATGRASEDLWMESDELAAVLNVWAIDWSCANDFICGASYHVFPDK